MFTSSNYFKNYSFHTAESDFSCQVYQLNYCYYHIMKNCLTGLRVFEVLTEMHIGHPCQFFAFHDRCFLPRSFVGVPPLFCCLPRSHLSSAGNHTSKMAVAQNDRESVFDETKYYRITVQLFSYETNWKDN